MTSLAQEQEHVRRLHLSDKLALFEWLRHHIEHECMERGCDELGERATGAGAIALNSYLSSSPKDTTAATPTP